MLPGLLLLVAAVLLRGSSTNRHVRGRLTVSAAAFLIDVAIGAADRWGVLQSTTRTQFVLLEPLLLSFGVINGLVALVINPLRADRLPDRFPTIVQDFIVIVLFALSATVVLEERVFAATAVSAVVVGLALQDTLGNLFAGLAIQIEKPFRVGHWVNVHGTDGLVSEITWRATKLRTKQGNFVVVPNSVLSKDTITNYSEPSAETRLELEVGVSYEVPPNRVIDAILEAIKDDPQISRTIPPEVLLANFADSSITYRVRLWTVDFATDERLKARVRKAIYYAFRRSDISIPFPIRTVIMKQAHEEQAPDSGALVAALARVSIFSSLEPERLGNIAAVARRRLYGAGEAIVRQGECGSSMFVLMTGQAVVTIEPESVEVARVVSGGFFGEMSLLTGAPRTASVRAAVDSEVLEITAEAFKQVIMAHPATLEQLGVAVAKRQVELNDAKAHGAATTPAEPPQSLVDRIRSFFGLDDD